MDMEVFCWDFLKYFGFGFGVVMLAVSCEIFVKCVVFYVVKLDEIVLGVVIYYVFFFVQGGDYCFVLVKICEGCFIKIEGNIFFNIIKGGMSVCVQVSVFSFYDINCFDGFYWVKEGKIQCFVDCNEWGLFWEEIDGEIMGKLIVGFSIWIVVNIIMSLMIKKVIEDFKVVYFNIEVVMYDLVLSFVILEVNEVFFGQVVILVYYFDKVDVIVSFDVDFLGIWIFLIEFVN